MTRAENWPGSLRWVVRMNPSHRQLAKLTPYEKQNGWRYSIICAHYRTPACKGFPAAINRSTSTCCTASTPPSRP